MNTQNQISVGESWEMSEAEQPDTRQIFYLYWCSDQSNATTYSMCHATEDILLCHALQGQSWCGMLLPITQPGMYTKS